MVHWDSCVRLRSGWGWNRSVLPLCLFGCKTSGMERLLEGNILLRFGMHSFSPIGRTRSSLQDAVFSVSLCLSVCHVAKPARGGEAGGASTQRRFKHAATERAGEDDASTRPPCEHAAAMRAAASSCRWRRESHCGRSNSRRGACSLRGEAARAAATTVRARQGQRPEQQQARAGVRPRGGRPSSRQWARAIAEARKSCGEEQRKGRSM
jgi:hypothetical protein